MTLARHPFDHLVVATAGPVRLRHKHIDDALQDFHWRRDPANARFDGAGPLTLPFSQYLEHVERELQFPDPRRCSYAIETLEGEHVGNLMYYNADAESAEFGISLGHEASRGQGLGSAATVAFLRHAWAELPFRAIYLHTLEWNERARRSFAATGFETAARVKRRDDWFLRMEVRREWWLLWDMEGRFQHLLLPRAAAAGVAAGVASPSSPA